ncbi:sugar kinase [Staphylococcus sp. ACRSN]|uniref:sugar kinase n=1 Tax=Staphylococcus sp. ACRSN TaxID=2918214 RepID=UPI001EF3CD1C|nr:sugar kinase [Staphylococcus sp. ACRSN]MCG7338897.1 sugar kinase [Staphylococcus sp. ACRSN]
MSKFLTIGEPIALFGSDEQDKSLEEAQKFTKYLAGAEVNVAVGVSRLGHSTQYVTRLGDDPFGGFIEKELSKNNIGTDYIEKTDAFWTAYQLKNRVSEGDPDIYYFRKGSAASHINEDILSEIDWSEIELVHLSGIFPAISSESLSAFNRLIEMIKQNQITSTFDPNLRPQLWNSEEEMRETINDLAKHADIILPGISEGKILVGSEDPEVIADFYLKQSEITSTVIVKLGEAGAYIKQKGNTVGMTIAGQRVEQVVDTVGAGDGFAVGVITGLLEGIDIKSTVARGNIIGALAVQSSGDNDGYPDRSKLDAIEKEYES